MENKDKNLAWAGKNHNKKRCVLPQITIDKLQHVLAQMIRTKMRCVSAQITSNKVERCVTTNHKRQFFFYERTRTKFWCGLTQSQQT